MWLCLNVLLDAFDFKSVVREELPVCIMFSKPNLCVSRPVRG